MRKRPVGVLIIGVFFLLGSALAVIVGISLIRPGTSLDVFWELNKTAYKQFAAVQTPAGYVFLGFAVITAIAGYGLIRGNRWAWWFAVAGFAINGVGDLIKMVSGEPLQGIAGFLIASAFLFYLFRPAPRAFFENEPVRSEIPQIR